MFVLTFSAVLSAQISEVLFEKTYAPTYRCGCKGLVETYDHGFLIVGWETLGDGNVFASVVRIDSVGNNVWSKSYGKPWNESNVIRTEATDVVVPPNGNYVISGKGEFKGVVVDGREFPYNNGFIFEIDDNGTLIWEQSYRLEGYTDYRHSCAFHSIDVLPGGGYVAAGFHDVGTSVEDPPRWNGYIVMINDKGEKIREISYESGDEPSLDWFNRVTATSDGGCIASGFYSNDISVSYISDGLVVKFDENGLEEWHYIYHTGNPCNFWGIAETSDNNFIVAGAEQTTPLESNLLVVRLSANGELIDSLILHNYDHNGALNIVKADDGYVVAGYVYQNQEEPYYSQSYLLKLNSEIDFKWELLVGGSEWEEAWAVIQTSSGGYAFAGVQIQYDDNKTTNFYHYLVKTSGEPGTGVENIQVTPRRFDLFQNYPNPFNPRTTIRYELPQRAHVSLYVFNTLGQQIAELVNKEQEAGIYEIGFDGTGLSSGIYFYRIESEIFSETKRFVLIK